MTQHFKREAESELGAGIVYIEISNGWPSRQVEVYGEIWRCGDETNAEYLADQPFDALGLEDKHAISAAEFDQMWVKAISRCQPFS